MEFTSFIDEVVQDEDSGEGDFFENNYPPGNDHISPKNGILSR